MHATQAPWDSEQLPPPRLGNARRRDPAREIAIVALLIGHPQLIDPVFEEVASIDFESAALAEFRSRMLDLDPEAYVSAEALAEALVGRGLAAERDRILGVAAQMPDWWCLRAEGPLSDAEVVLRQCLALQRKTSALHKELRSAEAALASDPTEQNFARLLDIKTGLADLANAEAAAEGFGEFAGRRNPPT